MKQTGKQQGSAEEAVRVSFYRPAAQRRKYGDRVMLPILLLSGSGGGRYGVSRERIRQVETVAMRKLKVLCAAKDLQRYCY